MSVQLTATRTAFRALERFAPGIGGRWAFRLWVSLPDQRSARRDERSRPGTTTTVTLPGGRRVAVESWGEGPPIYLVHGWGGWRGQLGAFVDRIVAAGFRAVAYDGPSHGESDPGHLGAGRSSMMELSDTLRAVVDAHGAPAGVIAHSGGSMAASAAVRDGLAIPRLAMIAPATDPAALIDQLEATVGFGPRVRHRIEQRAITLAGRPFADYDVLRLGDFADTPRTLVIHDVDDKEVPVARGRELADTWSDAELRTTEGLGHRRILCDDDVIADAVDFTTAA